MLRYLLILFTTSLSILTATNLDRIQYTWEQSPNFQNSKKIFLDAFIKCYGDLPLEKLQKSSREELVSWLDSTFDETYNAHQNNQDQLWLTAKVDCNEVGFIVIDVSKHPDEIYLMQFAIAPTFQRKGIGTTIIDQLIEQFPKCQKFAVVTRWVNEESVMFYKNYGFKTSPYSHEGYDPKLYGGFEYLHVL